MILECIRLVTQSSCDMLMYAQVLLETLRYEYTGFLEYSLGACDVKWSFTSGSALYYYIFPCTFFSKLWGCRIHLYVLLPSLCSWLSFWVSADVQLNCVKNYSVEISLIYPSILLISISLSSLLNFLHISQFLNRFLLFSRILIYQMFNWSSIYKPI